MLGVGDDTEKDQVIDYIYGYDAYDDDMDFETNEKRRWILGAFLHSRPAVVHYDASTSVIFAGANDGMLHAFLDSDGSELWGFVPPDLLDRLQYLHGASLEYFVDGAPRAAVIDLDGDRTVEPLEGDRVIIVFGERRGGSHFYALDVTDYDVPELLWEIHPEPGGDFEGMGQSWSTPNIGVVRVGGADRMAVFLGGGYDTNQDDDPVTSNDTMGQGIYVVDLFDGSLLWKTTALENPSMTYSIPSSIVAIDTTDSGYVDRLYVGDTGSQVWRCDIGDGDPANGATTQVFEDSGSGRKIFYPPDVSLEHGYEMLFFGTGDRAHPKNETTIDRIYTLKDTNPLIPFTPTDLVDVTANLVQDGTELERANTLDDLNTHQGWYIDLDEHPGEKVLSPSIVYFGVVYLTTFTPTVGDPLDPCYVGEGTARLYALDYRTGGAQLNFDTSTEELTKADRFELIGTAIPSGVVIALIEGIGASYIGVGGGIVNSDLINPAAILRIFWRQLH
jgi:type IV pilus assembly protein PilY1